jgi:hypothetical protein
MTTITDTQRAILGAAAEHPDGLAAPPARPPPAPRGAVAKAMLKAGLLERAGAGGADQKDLAWKLDGEAMLLRIGEAGLQALGVASETAAEPLSRPLAAPDPDGSSGGVGGARGRPGCAHGPARRRPGGRRPGRCRHARRGAQAGPGTHAAEASPAAATAPPGRAAGLREVARRVLAAWDDEAGRSAGLAEAIEALRAAAAPARSARAACDPAAPRTPRRGAAGAPVP